MYCEKYGTAEILAKNKELPAQRKVKVSYKKTQKRRNTKSFLIFPHNSVYCVGHKTDHKEPGLQSYIIVLIIAVLEHLENPPPPPPPPPHT